MGRLTHKQMVQISGRDSGLYASRRWRTARSLYLSKHPLCVMCRQAGRIMEATVVDHIRDHKGDVDLFWTESNWQSLCATHHSSSKARRVAGGCDEDGNPLDPAHRWNRRSPVVFTAPFHPP